MNKLFNELEKKIKEGLTKEEARELRSEGRLQKNYDDYGFYITLSTKRYFFNDDFEYETQKNI